MSILKIKDADGSDKYLEMGGVGSTADPFVPINGDYNIEIRRGNVLGHTVVGIKGHKVALGTTEEVVASIGAGDDIDQSGLATLAATVTLSSSSANDDSVGTGARTVTLTGLTALGVVQTEVIIMDGQTGVVSANTYSAIHHLQVLTVGATNWNEGTVYVGTGAIAAGKPAVICMAIGFDTGRSKGANNSFVCYYVVPTGKTFYGEHLTATVGTSNKDVQIHVESSTDGSFWNTEEVFEYESGSNITKPILAMDAQIGGKHIRLTAFSSAGTTNMAAVLDGELIDN